MECDEFISGYSSYRDGLLEPGREERFRRHLEACRSCARYDRVVRKGTEVLRDLPRPEPSPDFLSRLRHRIYHLRDGIPLTGYRGGSAAAVAVAAVGLLAFAWLPFATRVPVEVELPTVAVEEPARADVRPAATADPTAAAAGRSAESVELPRFFQPGLLGRSAGSDGTSSGWDDGGFWRRGGEPAAEGLAPNSSGRSFLATTGPSWRSGR